jgi:hypothetical protein
MNIKKSWREHIRGWVPKEPQSLKGYTVNASVAPKTKAELDKRLFKQSWIANSIISAVFLVADALFIQPAYPHIPNGASALFLGSLTASLVAVNLVLYWRYRKQKRIVEG